MQASCYRSLRVISCRTRRFHTSTKKNDANNASQGQAPQIGGSGQQGSQAATGVRDAVIATVAGIALVGLGGIAYHNYYKYDVLRKIDIAFRAGDDPILRLDNAARLRQISLESEDDDNTAHLRRQDQAIIDRIVDGKEAGHYYLIMGPKGVGKSTMLVDAMRKNQADGVASFEAHEDGEVFRLRLGKCLNFEYNEDWSGGLFQRKEPREAGPLLDIERVLNKLEKVAIRYAEKRNRPLCLIINNCHLIHTDDEGYALLHAFQQRAEAWAQARVMNIVFCSDDYWVWNKLRKNGSRMSVLHCDDLSELECTAAVRAHRPDCSSDTAKKIYSLLGGRLSILNRLIRSKGDLVEKAQEIIDQEKEWLLARRTMIPDHDDDVMDQQKESSCAWLLFQALVKKDEEAKARGETDSWISLSDSHVIMTRTDFITDLDHENMIRIDANHRVRADSTMLLNAMRKVVSEPGFQEILDATRSRVDDIESLHRTRELVIKDNDGVLPILQSLPAKR